MAQSLGFTDEDDANNFTKGLADKMDNFTKGLDRNEKIITKVNKEGSLEEWKRMRDNGIAFIHEDDRMPQRKLSFRNFCIDLNEVVSFEKFNDLAIHFNFKSGKYNNIPFKTVEERDQVYQALKDNWA